jgi:hypothetical protein
MLRIIICVLQQYRFIKYVGRFILSILDHMVSIMEFDLALLGVYSSCFAYIQEVHTSICVLELHYM